MRMEQCKVRPKGRMQEEEKRERKKKEVRKRESLGNMYSLGRALKDGLHLRLHCQEQDVNGLLLSIFFERALWGRCGQNTITKVGECWRTIILVCEKEI